MSAPLLDAIENRLTAPSTAFRRRLRLAHRRICRFELCGAGVRFIARSDFAGPDWRFQLGDVTNAIAPDYDDHEWRRVDVPHDYVVEGVFDSTNHFVYPGMDASWYSLHGFLPVQPAMYRKTVFIPASAKGKRLWLEFDGVFSNSRYWLNGQDIGSQYSGYSRSRFDITGAAACGSTNILTVRVDPRYDGWWYEGGGIYRHVRLVMLDPVHVAPDGVFVAPTVADPGNGIQADAMVIANTEVTNTSTVAVAATILSEILDARGQLVAAQSAVQALPAGGWFKSNAADPVGQGQTMVAGRPLPLSVAQHHQSVRQGGGSTDDELRGATDSFRRRPRLFPEWPARQNPRCQYASGPRRGRGGGAGPAF